MIVLALVSGYEEYTFWAPQKIYDYYPKFSLYPYKYRLPLTAIRFFKIMFANKQQSKTPPALNTNHCQKD